MVFRLGFRFFTSGEGSAKKSPEPNQLANVNSFIKEAKLAYCVGYEDKPS